MSMSGNGKAVVVTGASTGIGRAVAVHLAGRGYKVYAGVRKQADAESIRGEGLDSLVPLTIDVTDEASIAAARDRVAEEVGEAGLAALINNAGIVVAGPFEFLPIEGLRMQMEVNFIGQVAVTQTFLELIRKSRGRIITIGSTNGLLSAPFLGAYSASKFAIEAFCDALRMELLPWGIEVSLVDPGPIKTPIWSKSQDSGDEIRAKMGPKCEEYYGKGLDSFSAMSEKIEAGATDVSEVVKVTMRALESPKPKTRYLVGKGARVQSMIRHLPDRVVDGLITSQFGLPKKATR